MSYLLKVIKGLDIDRLTSIHELCKKEFKALPEIDRIETNLATIIGILAKENWTNGTLDFEVNPYEIDRKIEENSLLEARITIEDHAIQHHRINKIYGEFDAQGANRSLSILNGIRKTYLGIVTAEQNLTPDQIFLEVIRQVIDRILKSSNYKPIPREELDLCTEILVVDSFIRCKIFKNPSWNQVHAYS